MKLETCSLSGGTIMRHQTGSGQHYLNSILAERSHFGAISFPSQLFSKT